MQDNSNTSVNQHSPELVETVEFTFQMRTSAGIYKEIMFTPEHTFAFITEFKEFEPSLNQMVNRVMQAGINSLREQAEKDKSG